MGWVYLLQAGDRYKIGCSNLVKYRARTIARQVKQPIRILHMWHVPFDVRYQVETYFHHLFAARRLTGEWFALTPEDVRAFCTTETVILNGEPQRLSDLTQAAQAEQARKRAEWLRKFFEFMQSRGFK